jgi:hypothetical protein
MYLRFVIPGQDADSRQPQGVFRTAYELLDSGALDRDAFARVRAELDWFVKHLPIPQQNIHPRAIFWFRSDAKECTRRIWDLVHLLREHGRVVEMKKTSAPGRIIYRDGLQVGAMPLRPKHKVRK